MKKLTAVLLALVMMTLPMLGLAASPAEMIEEAVAQGRPVTGKITFDLGAVPGLSEEEEAAAIVNDVVDALGFTFAQQGDQVDFALTLSGNEVANFAYATADEDTYIKSNLLSENALVFNKAEGKVVLDYLLNMVVASGEISQSEIDEMKAAIEQAMQQAEALMDSVNMEDIDSTELILVMGEIVSKVTTAEVTQQPKNCDTAVTVAKLTLTGEDVAKICKASFKMMEQVPQFATMLHSAETLIINGETVTPEEFMAKLPELADQVAGMIQGDIPVEIYMDAIGDPVYGIATVTMKGENENGKEETIAMEMNYARLTVNDGATHTVNVIAKDANNEGAAISVNVLDNEQQTTVNVGIDALKDGAAQNVATVNVKTEKEYGETESEEDMEIAVTVIDTDSGEEISFRMEVDSEAKKINDQDVAYECEMDIYIMGQEEEIFTVKAYEETGNAPESIISDAAVRVGQMTEEEFNTFLNDEVMVSLQNALVGAVQNLPSSVLMLMMQQQ